MALGEAVLPDNLQALRACWRVVFRVASGRVVLGLAWLGGGVGGVRSGQRCDPAASARYRGLKAREKSRNECRFQT